MIRLHVSTVVRVTDGFSGRALGKGSLQCRLDGRAVTPQYRDGGYLVFSDLEPGAHELILFGAWYQAQHLALTVQPEQTQFLWAVLQPKEGYPFPKSALRFDALLTRQGVPLADRSVWAAALRTDLQLLVAQDQALAGEKSLRVFCRGRSEQLPIPGGYVFLDGEKTEAATILSLSGDDICLAEPLARSHGRSVVICPAQHYTTTRDGRLRLVLQRAGELILFLPDPGLCQTLDLRQENCPETVAF